MFIDLDTQRLWLKSIDDSDMDFIAGIENKKLSVNGKEYDIIKLLGKGKGGYSYLAEYDHKQYVLKQIHHEPCDYYQFGNKIQSEINDYHRLKEIGINLPQND